MLSGNKLVVLGLINHHVSDDGCVKSVETKHQRLRREFDIKLCFTQRDGSYPL